MNALECRSSFCAMCAGPVPADVVLRCGETYCSVACAQAAWPVARILLVPRDAESESRTRAVLSGAGYRAHAGPDAVGALREAVRGGFDLVLADADAQPLDGFAVAAILRADPASADVPVLIVAESDEPEQRTRATGAGALGLLVRPGPAGLLQAVSTHLRRRSPAPRRYLYS